MYKLRKVDPHPHPNITPLPSISHLNHLKIIYMYSQQFSSQKDTPIGCIAADGSSHHIGRIPHPPAPQSGIPALLAGGHLACRPRNSTCAWSWQLAPDGACQECLCGGGAFILGRGSSKRYVWLDTVLRPTPPISTSPHPDS